MVILKLIVVRWMTWLYRKLLEMHWFFTMFPFNMVTWLSLYNPRQTTLEHEPNRKLIFLDPVHIGFVQFSTFQIHCLSETFRIKSFSQHSRSKSSCFFCLFLHNFRPRVIPTMYFRHQGVLMLPKKKRQAIWTFMNFQLIDCVEQNSWLCLLFNPQSYNVKKLSNHYISQILFLIAGTHAF